MVVFLRYLPHRFFWTTFALPLHRFHSMPPFAGAAHSHNYHFNVPLTFSISSASQTVKNETERQFSLAIQQQNKKKQNMGVQPYKKQLLLKSVSKRCFPGRLWAWGWSVSRYFRLRWFSNLPGLRNSATAGDWLWNADISLCTNRILLVKSLSLIRYSGLWMSSSK